MTKLKIRNATTEEMEQIEPGEELMVDLTRSPQALDDDMKQRVEYLQVALADALGHASQYYPRVEEWEEEDIKHFHNCLKHAWHYRQEIRLLFSMANPDHDVTDIAEGWRFITDEVFGPLQETIH